MYKTSLNDWPESTSGVAKVMCFGLLVAFNGVVAANEILDSPHPPLIDKNHTNYHVFGDIGGSSFGMVQPSALGGGINYEALPLVDPVDAFWSSLDDGTLFDDVGSETWAMVDEIIARNPGIAGQL